MFLSLLYLKSGSDTVLEKKKKILLIEKWPIGPKEVWIRVLLHNKKKSNNFLILNPSHVATAVVVGSTP